VRNPNVSRRKRTYRVAVAQLRVSAEDMAANVREIVAAVRRAGGAAAGCITKS
jgi:predicted amidohydrolase